MGGKKVIIVYNTLVPFRGFSALNFCGILFVRKGIVLSKEISNHEQIHSAQIKELLFLFFYLFYLLEWFVKLFRYGKNSYYNISFEREAYKYMSDDMYLAKRKRFAFINFL